MGGRYEQTHFLFSHLTRSFHVIEIFELRYYGEDTQLQLSESLCPRSPGPASGLGTHRDSAFAHIHCYD